MKLATLALATLALATLATMATFATPLKWICDWPEARAQSFTLYHGETATFEPSFRVNGSVATNVAVEACYIQTNGMGEAWWRLENATFHPSNDVGAASYRFFVRARAGGDVVYRANGILRMQDSPGFEPAVLPLPRRSLDFDAVEISNAPWPTAEEIEAAAAAALDAAKEYTDGATNATLAAAREYTDGAISAAGAVTPGMVTNIVNDIAPTPGDYETVSNKAMNAVQPPALTNFVKSATNVLDTAIKGRGYVISLEPVTNYANQVAQSATNYTDSVVAPIWQIVLGDRVWFAVTNYMRTVDGVAPSLQLWEVREGVTNLIYHSTEEITNLIGKATAPLATTQALDAVRAAMPSKAWSGYQSATGADNPAPADVTIISTPVVQLTGGGEWTPHTLSAGGTVWTLESNGFTSISGGTNGYLSIRNTVTGEEVLTVEERSIIPSVPVNAAFEAKGVGEGFFYTVYADARPTLFTSTNLTGRAKAAWDAEGDDPNVVVNSWTNNGDGTWTADVTLVVPSVEYFAYVGVQESKDTVISNKRAASFDGGVVIGGAKYRLGTALINGVRVLTAEAIQ